MRNEEIAVSLPEAAVERIARRAAELVTEQRQVDQERFVGVREAAEHLGCRPHRIYDLVHQRAIPFYKEGSRLLFRCSELTAWLEGRAAQTSSRRRARPGRGE